jgi:hypothetical protein
MYELKPYESLLIVKKGCDLLIDKTPTEIKELPLSEPINLILEKLPLWETEHIVSLCEQVWMVMQSQY